MTLNRAYEDLEEFLAGPTEMVVPPEATADADRMLARLARLARRERDAVDAAKAKHALIDEWFEGELDEINAQRGPLVAALGIYHTWRLARDPEALTIRLPSGVLASRAQEPEWIVDDDLFVEWAQRAAPDLVRTPEPKPVPDRAAIKSVLTPQRLEQGVEVEVVSVDGEVVPGVRVVARPRKFSPKPTLDD